MVELFDRFVWLALGITWGWLLALYLSRRPPLLVAVAPMPTGSDAERDEWRQATERDGVDRKVSGR